MSPIYEYAEFYKAFDFVIRREQKTENSLPSEREINMFGILPNTRLKH